jgi:flagellar basal body-associated protein FliL
MKEYITTIIGIIISVLVIALVIYFLFGGKRRKAPKGPGADSSSKIPPPAA